MALSKYHNKYSSLIDEEILNRIEAKEDELIEIFKKVSLDNNNNLARVAVLGCADKRFVSAHKILFEKILNRKVDLTTFDISTDHLEGETNVIQHDCTLPLPGSLYDVTFGHVVLKFIETGKQYDFLKNSYDALNLGGIAIHVFDNEEISSENEKLSDGYWRVPLDVWKTKLTEEEIQFMEIDLKYGPALVILKR
ncbi:MAG: hypothetical protein PF572_04085 [Patescibacteria group bacterium]|jgi:hypothetical protein|nr:hypothetical protein [Patescibacteria group bacterium]